MVDKYAQTINNADSGLPYGLTFRHPHLFSSNSSVILVPPGLKAVLTGYGIYSEKSTSTYNLAYAKHYNFNVDYINLARYQIGNFPAAFSRRVMDRLGIINKGIH